MKYLISNEEVNETDFTNRLEEEVNKFVEETFDEFIDECYEEVKVGNITFSPSEVMKSCAKGDYDLWLGGEQSYRLEEAQSELERNGRFVINENVFEIEE